MLRCSDNSLYCGVTTGLHRRVHEHNHTGKAAKYTRSRRPVTLVWFNGPVSKEEAYRLEFKIKKLKKLDKEKLVEDFTYTNNELLC